MELLVAPVITEVVHNAPGYYVKGQTLDSETIKIFAKGAFGEKQIGEGTPIQFNGTGILAKIPSGTNGLIAEASSQFGGKAISNLFELSVDFTFDSSIVTFDSTTRTFDEQ